MDYCKTCVYYPPSSCDGKPCTQCDPESSFQNCYVKKEADSKPTNADRIRSMTNEELARFLQGVTLGLKTPLTDWVDWLKQEATE